ncbi:putative nuclease HARBI1 isoform X2 [Protopterus annectens]|nr:putative nuclease HARBI1 isoform X2 [Protopterus annectens]
MNSECTAIFMDNITITRHEMVNTGNQDHKSTDYDMNFSQENELKYSVGFKNNCHLAVGEIAQRAAMHTEGAIQTDIKNDHGRLQNTTASILSKCYKMEMSSIIKMSVMANTNESKQYGSTIQKCINFSQEDMSAGVADYDKIMELQERDHKNIFGVATALADMYMQQAVLTAGNHSGVCRRPRRRRVIRPRLTFHPLPDTEIVDRYCVDRGTMQELVEMCRPHMQSRGMRGIPISVDTKVCVALRILATGTFQRRTGDTVGVSQASASRILHQFLDAVLLHAEEHMWFPRTMEDRNNTMQEFYEIAHFPEVLGAVDCTHIAIKAPPGEQGQRYINRKGFHSINCQVVCSAQGLIYNVSSGHPGSAHDCHIWHTCDLYQRFLRGDFPQGHLIGDVGYAVEPWLMTPLRNPETMAENAYNTALSQTRIIVERVFRLLKARFRCLDVSGGALQYGPETCSKIFAVCAILHNMLVRKQMQEGRDIQEEEIPELTSEEVPVEEPMEELDTKDDHARQRQTQYTMALAKRQSLVHNYGPDST